MKKIILIIVLFLVLNQSYGQICVDSENMLSTGGLNISYCTIYLGSEENCKKYKVTISIVNNDKDYISIAGSNIIMLSGHDMFPAVGKCRFSTSYADANGDVRLVFPAGGLGFSTELKPGYSVTNSYIVYTDKTYPVVKYYITPNYMNVTKNETKQSKKEIPKETAPQKNDSQNLNNNSTNSTSSNQTNQINQEKKYSDDLQSLWARQTELIRQIRVLEPFTTVYSYEGNIGDKLEYRIQKTKDDIVYLENYLDKLKGKEKEFSDAKEKEQKALQDKQAQFEKYMSDGDNYMSSENYDAAMNSYSSASSSATNSSESSRAQTAYAAAQKAKADAARKVRVAEKTQIEKQQNDATVAAVSGFAGVMALLHDSYSSGKFAAKGQVGVGYGSLPLIVNSAKNGKSLIKNSNQILLHLGLKLGFLNNKGISFDITPSVGFGFSSFQKGIDGGASEYGGLATLYLAKKATSTAKLFVEGGYYKRTGTYNYDEDVAKGANSATDNVEKGTFNYSMYRYGGGVKLTIVNDDNQESYIKPGIFFEHPSFFTSSIKPVMVANVQCYIISNLMIDFTYSKNYFIPGKIDYRLTKENKNYFAIKIIRQGKIK